jgi:RHH-type transcriptional regulator, proline utilization regulon repressor / proline dehydrogenase / delta 1-pyrroline-5-carboxylate dehydrogenase
MTSTHNIVGKWNRRERAILRQIETHLETVEEMQLNPQQLNQAASMIAGLCLTLSKDLETRNERKQSQQLSQLMNDDLGQLFSTLLTDRVPRLSDGTDVTKQAQNVLSNTGIPSSMPLLDQCQLIGLKLFGGIAPKTIGNAVRQRIRKEAQTFLMPGERPQLVSGVQALKKDGVQVNVNQLGEEVLGNAEAQRHMDAYLDLLKTPGVDTISVKTSSVCAQLSVIAFETSLTRVCAALRVLYRAAMENPDACQKLVMLDMEAYRDLELTYQAFTTVLDEPEFQTLTAGIVLQAYLPDSHDVHKRLLAWSARRQAAGGALVQLRLVKGANLAVERIESAIAGWAVPIFPSKVDVDASFKLMIERAITLENLSHIRLGVASHNLFDVAYTLCLAKQRGITSGLHFEVLSGMAGGLSRVLLGLGCEVLVYSPAVTDSNLHAAVAYLVRRLDENTADQNFLRHSFDMVVGDVAWLNQEAGFLESRRRSLKLSLKRRRRSRLDPPQGLSRSFQNEPDTDFTLMDNRTWLQAHITNQTEAPKTTVQSSVIRTPNDCAQLNGADPSVPESTPYFIRLATPLDVSQTLDQAQAAGRGWSETPPEIRIQCLRNIAAGVRDARGELIPALMMDGGKAVIDADAEISEAIDFCTYYADRYERLMVDDRVLLTPRGVTVITPPWNFPFAIPLGGVVAALVTGNPVILKPALETTYIASQLIEICSKVGLPKDVLQFLVATDEVATPLITDPRVQTVVLTGGTSTAQLFQRLRPNLHLLAETGGKNSTIVSHFADQDLAINSIIQSAFGHAGQKCSATSLLIITQTLANDPSFKSHLIDAAASMSVGTAWDLNARVTPMIQPPEGLLYSALTTLEDGESWWLEPKPHPDNPSLWSPGIKGSVSPGSASHLTEFFGPMLSVMVAKDLTEAIEWANATPYGLTSGFHSLDEGEQIQFLETMNAGNLYINRTTTGAIVQRQPFGGRKASCFGPGAKAGGPNYLSMFVHRTPASRPSNLEERFTPTIRTVLDGWRSIGLNLAAVTTSYLDAMTALNERYDPTGLHGQDNLFRYQFNLPVLVLAFDGYEPQHLAAIHLALMISGNPFEIVAVGRPNSSNPVSIRHVLGNNVADRNWQSIIARGEYGHIRVLGAVPDTVFPAAAQAARCVDTSPVLWGGSELKKYAQEQSISIDYHRYGHLGLRERAPASIIGLVTYSVPE